MALERTAGVTLGLERSLDPDTTVGIDLAYISAELAAQTPDNAFLIDGPPVLAVEVLSPSDKHEDVVEKIEIYQRFLMQDVLIHQILTQETLLRGPTFFQLCRS